MPGRLPLERLVSEAAEQITRFSAPEAFSAATGDGIIIDIRSQDARELHGVEAGALPGAGPPERSQRAAARDSR